MLEESRELIGAEQIRHITPGTVTKSAEDEDTDTRIPSEALTLELVYRCTTIPVPRLRRVIRDHDTNVIVMDYIPGRQLSHVWREMSTWRKLRVVFTLRSYVLQLRAIQHPGSAIPGPIVPPGHPPRECTSPLFGWKYEWRGPFASYDKLAAFFNDRYKVALVQHRRVPTTKAESRVRADPFDNSGPLVLTHQDINMRNIIVGDDGRLWLIDWAWAGFYPGWFEYVATRIQSENEETVVHRSEPLWDLLVPFICGLYDHQEKWWRRMAVGMEYK
ncbi:hypothetical protein EVJ58_g8856 [Rhodofomes roseus]|uniref:Aminoglycoside phosphotransferase domain-containing protein n=1 Tax=Rhodofomes roseus TaxID=34475 RepID=A0A4Y9Y0R8_9APHY|nr:hypothetical protein EVJ58_g8856 [Rhodofomes roseus]